MRRWLALLAVLVVALAAALVTAELTDEPLAAVAALELTLVTFAVIGARAGP